jgi:hypothetical protein
MRADGGGTVSGHYPAPLRLVDVTLSILCATCCTSSRPRPRRPRWCHLCDLGERGNDRDYPAHPMARAALSRLLHPSSRACPES